MAFSLEVKGGVDVTTYVYSVPFDLWGGTPYRIMNNTTFYTTIGFLRI